ncbi:MAG: cohesin domain-containing protein [Methanosarcinales archaeon]|nr:cohesin domain-containing protein [Methanosarcinales archaeon]
MNKNCLFRVGILLAVMLVFAVPATADNVIYFDPDPCYVAPGESIVVTMYVNNSDPVQNWQDDIYFDPTVVNVTSHTAGQFPLGGQMSHWGDRVRRGGVTGDGANLEPGIQELGTLTFEGISPGTSTLEHQGNVMGNWYGQPLPDQVWINGTIICGGSPETFTKSLPEGWNLISLPLTPTDNSVSAVLSSVSHNAVRQYDATTHQFEDATTMDPGTGYFVNVTTAGTWEYEGTPVSSTSSGLESGLNMIGVPNCTMDVGTAMGSADYWYVSRWNANDQKYDVHNPSAPPSFNGFTTMTAGEGYFVSAKSDDGTFTISCSS